MVCILFAALLICIMPSSSGPYYKYEAAVVADQHAAECYQSITILQVTKQCRRTLSHSDKYSKI